MNTLKISETTFSESVWKAILFNMYSFGVQPAGLKESFLVAEQKRSAAEFNTGSIRLSTYLALYAVALYFSPKYVAEVGTFIGKSTAALMYGASNSIVYTCDASNNISIDPVSNCTLHQFPMKTSTQMLTEISSRNIKLDFLFIDGRISIQDLDIIARSNGKNILLAFDDFEGVEKGVANVLLCRQQEFFNDYLLVPPCPNEIGSKFFGEDLSGSTLALLIPRDMVSITRQS